MMAKVRVIALILALLPENLSSDFVTVQRNLSFGRFNTSDLSTLALDSSHSRPQRPQSFWSSLRIATPGKRSKVARPLGTRMATVAQGKPQRMRMRLN